MKYFNAKIKRKEDICFNRSRILKRIHNVKPLLLEIPNCLFFNRNYNISSNLYNGRVFILFSPDKIYIFFRNSIINEL